MAEGLLNWITGNLLAMLAVLFSILAFVFRTGYHGSKIRSDVDMLKDERKETKAALNEIKGLLRDHIERTDVRFAAIGVKFEVRGDEFRTFKEEVANTRPTREEFKQMELRMAETRAHIDHRADITDHRIDRLSEKMDEKMTVLLDTLIKK